MTEIQAKRLILRFFSKVNKKGPNECWEWTGSRNEQRYGQFWDGVRCIRAHRFIWELFIGSIPDGMYICHKCDNPSCCNPEHLFCGTQQDNIDDMYSKGRGRFRLGVGQTSYLNPANIPLIADYDDLSELRPSELGVI